MTANRRRSPRVWLALAFGAGVSGALAGGMYFAARLSGEEASETAALPVSDAAGLRALGPGRRVLVAGRIAPDAPTPFRRFVAYLHYEPYRDTSGSTPRTRWRVAERVTPPFRLETGAGAVRVGEGRYQLGTAAEGPDELDERGPSVWREERGGDTWDPSRPATGAQWYTGLEPGEPVVVWGTLAAGGEVPEVKAVRVFAGTRDALVAAARGSARFFQVAAGVLAGVCLGFLLALGWPLVRPARR